MFVFGLNFQRAHNHFQMITNCSLVGKANHSHETVTTGQMGYVISRVYYEGYRGSNSYQL